MKKLLPLLIIATTLSACANYDRAEQLILEYTEHMEVYSYSESASVLPLSYYGNSTIKANQGGIAAIIVTRVNKQEHLFSVGFMGELNDGLFEDGSFIIEQIGFAELEIGEETGIEISLETNEYVVDELMTVDYKNFFESLKELSYADIKYAMNFIIKKI